MGIGHLSWAPLLLWLGAAGETATTVRLRPRALVRGAELRVADVAEIVGPRAEEISRVRLGYAPAPGAERRVEPALIAARVASAGVPRDALHVEGPVSVVTVETVTIEGREIARRALEDLRAKLPSGGTAEIQGAPEDLAVPRPISDATPVELETVMRSKELRGNVAIDVVARAAGERLATVQLCAVVKIEREALVARGAIAKGEPAQPSRFERARIDATRLIGEPVVSFDALKGRVLARPVQDGAVLLADDLAAAPIFRKGDRAQLVVRRGALRVEANVRVDADAPAGALVPVTVLEFGRSMVARVKDDGTLELPGSEKEKGTR